MELLITPFLLHITAHLAPGTQQLKPNISICLDGLRLQLFCRVAAKLLPQRFEPQMWPSNCNLIIAMASTLLAMASNLIGSVKRQWRL